MARFNEILTGRFNRALQKELQLKGGPPSAQLASEIMPTYPFFRGREARITEEWRTYAIVLLPVATAGQISGCRLRNPIGNNVIAVIERISFHNRTATDDHLLIFVTSKVAANIGDLGGATPNGVSLDSRQAPEGQGSSIRPSSGNSITQFAGSQIGQFAAAAFVEVTILVSGIQELPLAPGSTITLATIGANEALVSSWQWRERVLEESELTA